MELFPAIDIRGGNCVRLYQGDYDKETTYGSDPVAQAEAFISEGATWIHVVDLDAARSGTATNRDVIASICDSAHRSNVMVQSGGGVRSLDAAKALADAGVDRVVIGTAALEQPELVAEVAAQQAVAVGLDARGADLAAHGWEVSSGRDLFAVAKSFAAEGVGAFVVTEIARDGTLEGPSMDQLKGVMEAIDGTGAHVVASGGIGNLSHIEALDALTVNGQRLEGAIMGKALYEGAFTLPQALDVLT